MLYFAPWKATLIAVLCVLGLVFTAPNFVSKQTAEGLPDWLPHKQVNLGLDLQGGSHLFGGRGQRGGPGTPERPGG